MLKLRHALPLALLLAASSSFALESFTRPIIGSLSATPNPAKPGDTITFRVDPSQNGKIDCGLLVTYGNGQQEQIAVKQGFPKEFTHVFDAPGKFTVKVEGKEFDGMNNCKGEATTTVAVQGVVAPSCPTGWELIKGSTKKNGAFSCRAAQPAELPRCSSGLKGYYQNGVIGCK